MSDKPKCGAYARSTKGPCQAPARANGRCRMHGGLSTGPKSEEGQARALANLRPFQGADPQALREQVQARNVERDAREVWLDQLGVTNPRARAKLLEMPIPTAKEMRDVFEQEGRLDTHAQELMRLRMALARKENDWMFNTLERRATRRSLQ